MTNVDAQTGKLHKRGTPWVIGSVALAVVAVIVAVEERASVTIEQARVASFLEHRAEQAREVTRRIELYFTVLAGALRPLAAAPEVQRLEEVATRRFLKLKSDELRPFGVWDVGVIDAAGALRYSATDQPMEGTDFSMREYFQEAQQNASSGARVIRFVDFEGLDPDGKGVLVGIPMSKAVAVDDPASPSGEFAGMVACLVKLDFMVREFVAPIKPPGRGHAFLVDNDCNVLWSPGNSLAGKNLAAETNGIARCEDMVRGIKAGRPGTAEYRHYRFDESTGRYTEETEEKLVAYEPIQVGRHPWAIGVWTPKEDALKLIRSARRRHHIVMGLSILVIFLAAMTAGAVSSRFRSFLEDRLARKAKELRESHERLLTVLDSLDAIVYVADMETYEILFVNRRARDVFGNVVGETCWRTLQNGQTGPCDFCTSAALMGTDGEPTGPHLWEFQNTVDGRWYEIHDQAIRWVDGRYVRLEIAFDITERHRQEQLIVEQGDRLQEQQAQLEASRQKLDGATAKVSELIDTAAQDQSLDMHYDNPNLVTCWRVRSCQNTWCPCHGREAIRCWQVEGTYCDKAKPATFAEKVVSCRSCEVFRRSCPDRLTELAEGFNNLMFLFSRKAEEMRQLRYHAIQQERMATIGQMAAGIAHEIGNPIASLFSLVQVLKATVADGKGGAQLALMQQCISRVSKIVREIVDFGRPIRSENWTHGDVEKVARDALELLRYDRRARKIDMKVAFAPDMPKTMIIEHQLQQVFVNVMLNALDAMHGRGALTVHGYRADGAIEVAISDTGEGMRPEQIQHIFEPFYTTKAARKGTGLGLALSYNIMQRHGGAIRVQGEPGKGSTFTIVVPLREPNGGQNATSQDSSRR